MLMMRVCVPAIVFATLNGKKGSLDLETNRKERTFYVDIRLNPIDGR